MCVKLSVKIFKQSTEGSLLVLCASISSSFLSATLPETNDDEVRSSPPPFAINHYCFPTCDPGEPVNTYECFRDERQQEQTRLGARIYRRQSFKQRFPKLKHMTDSALLKQLLYSQQAEENTPQAAKIKFIDNIKTNIKRCHTDFIS